MSAPRRRMFAAILVLALLGGSAGTVWRVRAQNGNASPRVPGQALAGRVPPAATTNGDRGATYHFLEGKATRVTTRFADAIAVADRTLDGQLSTRVTDLAGNDVAVLRVRQIDSENDSMEFSLPDKSTRHAARRSGLRPTLDWSNEQAYSFWKDRDALNHSSLEWQDTLLRPAGARKRDASSEALRTDTEWVGGMSATVIKKVGTHTSYVTGRKTTGLVFISSFKADGVEVGSSQWWPQEQTLAWSFPGLTEGYIDASRLTQSGGWTFTPDMAWLNTQNLAFHQFHTMVKTGRSVSERREGWLERMGALIAPRLLANEVGCDGLHWLDQSVVRPCCDSHDRCYEKQDPNCTASSWWMIWSSWQCDRCNILATVCFLTLGGSKVYVRFP